MTETELREKYNLFTDAWKLFKRWGMCEFPFTDERWVQIIQETQQFYEQHGSSEMAKHLMQAVAAGLDDHDREVRARTKDR